jgi:hypothetical protein
MPVKNLKASGVGRFCEARKKLVLPDKYIPASTIIDCTFSDLQVNSISKLMLLAAKNLSKFKRSILFLSNITCVINEVEFPWNI